MTRADDPGRLLVDLLAATGAIAADAEHIVTHGAVIVLDGDRAWKFKRPVAYRYMDFSTVERRRDALRAELDLNRRTAPQICLGVHAITRTAEGVELDGKGEVLDWALEMARFPDDALLARYAGDGRIDDTLLTGLAGQVVAMHVGAEVSDDHHGAARLLDVVVGESGQHEPPPRRPRPRPGRSAHRATDRTDRFAGNAPRRPSHRGTGPPRPRRPALEQHHRPRRHAGPVRLPRIRP